MATDQAGGTGLVRCPACKAGTFVIRTEDQGFRCSSCGHWAAASLLAELSALDAHLVGLTARRDWLLQLVADGTRPAPPGPAPATSSAGTRNLLLTLGSILLGLAGVFFTAVAWSALGPSARLVLLALIGVLLGAGGRAANRRLPAAAEALAAVGAVLIATSAYAAPALGAVELAGPEVEWHIGASVALTVVFGLTMAATRMNAWAIASAATAVIATMSAGIHLSVLAEDPLVFTGLAWLVGTALAVAVLSLPRMSLPRLAPVSRSLNVSWAVATGLVLFVGALSTAAWFGAMDRLAGYAVALVLFAILGPLLRLVNRRIGPNLALANLGFFVGLATVVLLSAPAAATARQLLAVGVAGVGLVGLSLIDRVHALLLPYVLVVGGGAIVIPALGPTGLGTPDWEAGLGLAAAALLAAAWLGRSRLRLSSPTPGTSGPGPDGGPGPWQPGSPTAAGTGWWALAWPSAGCAGLAWIVFLDGRAESLFAADSLPVEAFAVPAGVFLVAAGVLWARRRRQAGWPAPGTNPVLLPGLLAVVVPTGVLSFGVSYSDGTALARSLALLLGGAALLSLGAYLRVAALVVTGVVAVSMGTIAHLVAIGGVLPRWVSFAAAGVLLLAVGARWEWLGSQGSRTRRWFGGLR